MSTSARSLLLASLLLVACGGGTGGPPTAPSGGYLVGGEYRFVAMERVGSDASALTGIMTPANLQFSMSDVWLSGSGASAPGAFPFLIAYSVTPDRLFTLGFGGLQGRITADGMLATAISTGAVTDNELYVLVRHRPTPLLSDLSGSWKLIAFGRAGPNYEAFSSIGDVTIDDFGLVTYTSITTNLDGDIDPLPGVLQPDQLVVLAGGTLALQRAGALAYRGGVSQDGNLILMAGNFASGRATLFALVRKGTASPNQFVGAYGTAALGMAGTTPQAYWGPLFRPLPPSDATLVRYYNNDGEVIGPLQQTLGIGVLPDGELTMVAGGINSTTIFRGMLAANGAYAIYGGGISPGSGQLFRVLIR